MTHHCSRSAQWGSINEVVVEAHGHAQILAGLQAVIDEAGFLGDANRRTWIKAGCLLSRST
jgi:hypothetical protein